MAGFRKPGRDIKRQFARTQIIKVRSSEEHKNLIALLKAEYNSTIISDADIIEFALEYFAKSKFQLYWNEKKKDWGEPW